MSGPLRPMRRDPDAPFFRAYLVGCGVLLLAFLIGWAIIAYFWLR